MSPVVHYPLEPWSRLDGKIIVVTGASSGLGREICLDLASAGCRIVVLARRADRLKCLCDQINKMDISASGNRRAIAVVLDVMATGPTIEACVKKAWDAFGHIDALVNSAGVAGVRGTKVLSLEFPDEEFDHVVNTNLRGSWLVSKAVGRWMRSRGGGSIINISSISGVNRTQSHGAIAYGPSKAAMDSMTKIMALELGGDNIRVNSIAPGLFKSEITENLLNQNWVKAVAEKIIPLKTNGTVDPAITTLIRYLIHDSSAFISGNVFIVDAGTSIPGIPLYSSL